MSEIAASQEATNVFGGRSSEIYFRQDHIDDIVAYFMGQESLQGIMNAFRVSLAYETTLR